MLTTDDFRDLWKPNRPLASNNPAREGLYRTNRDNAYGKRFIETAPKTYRNLIVLDLDVEQADWRAKDLEEHGAIPTPSFITVNPATEHAHLGFFIDGHAGTAAGVKYFTDIARGLSSSAGADAAYGGRLMRNPLSSYQTTTWGTDHLYTLTELKSFTSASTRSAQPPTDVEGGRNASSFDSLRKWAYRARKSYSDLESWNIAVWERACEINILLTNPLNPEEVKSITGSVSKWVWDNITPEAFTEIQKKRSARASAKRTQVANERYDLVRFMLKENFSLKEIASNLQISYNASKKLVQRVKAS